MGGRILGVSARTLEEELAAVRGSADYLGVGAVFPTASKPDAGMCRLDGLALVARCADIPVVGIGGIHAGNAEQVVRAGADGIAVVSAVMQAGDPQQASARLRALVAACRT